MLRFLSLLRIFLMGLGMLPIFCFPLLSTVAADKPEIFVQLGHQNSVGAVAFSPDGKYAGTGSEDLTVKLWDVASGLEIRTFVGHAARIDAVAVSPGGKLVASGDEKGTLKVWDAMTGQEILSIAISNRYGVRFLCFAPDGQTVSSVVAGTLTVWDVATGRSLKAVERIGSYSFLASGETLLIAEPDYQKYVLVEAASGQELGRFGSDKSLSSDKLSFSRDGRYRLSMEDNYSAKRYDFEMFDMHAKRTIATWQVQKELGNVIFIALSPDGRQALTTGNKGLKLWDAMSGRELKTLARKSTWMATFSPDGRYVLAAGSYAPSLWETSTGRYLRAFIRKPLSNVYSAAFSPDGSQAIVESSNAQPLLWDVANGKAVKIFKGYTDAFKFSEDGRHLLLIKKDKTIERWDLAADKPVHLFQGKSVAFSRNGRIVAEKVADGQVNVWDFATGKEILNHTETAGRIQNFRVSGNGRYLLTLVNETARRIDLETGAQEIFNWKGVYYPGVTMSPDGRYFAGILQTVDAATNKITDTLKLYDIEAQREVLSYEGVTQATSFIFSPDGRQILFAQKSTLLLCDVSSGTVVKTFTGHTSIAYSLEFSPGGDRILSAGTDNSIRLWDTATGRTLRTFAGHSNWVKRASLSADGKRVLSVSNDSTARLWDMDTGKERAKFLSFTDGEWIVITPEGYYNASDNGEKYLNVRIGNTIYSIDNFREAFYRPDLVTVALSGGSLKDFRTLAEVKQPPTVDIVDTPSTVATDTVTVHLRLADNGGGIGDIRLYLNGTAVVMDSRAVQVSAKGTAALMKAYTLKLAGGSNVIKAVAFNAANTAQSNEATLEVTASFASAGKPSLAALVIGINEFKNPKLKLNYPVADADLFAQALAQSAAGLFDKVNIRKLTARATTTNQVIIREIKAFQSLRPEDLFVFYIASHGTVDEGEYFLITSNVGSLRTEKLRTDAISQNMLKEALANIPATKKLILIDTCNAGALGEALQVAMLTRGMSEDTALKILSRAVGSTILSASTSVQEALEGYKGHGLFTYVLAEGLKGKADKGKTGYIKTTDLADYVDTEVPALAEKVFKRAQYPTISISGQAFPIGKTK